VERSTNSERAGVFSITSSLVATNASDEMSDTWLKRQQMVQDDGDDVVPYILGNVRWVKYAKR
jgi:hypothetical protein